jgi:glycosyltransferase involved in cell wall biosynthesis
MITAVILARNEALNITEIIRDAKPFVDEVVVVDGHSTDETRELASREGARVLLDKGKGKGDGIRTAIRELKPDILVLMDADGSHDPHDIPRLVKPILAGQYDMVVGSRGMGGSDELHGDLNKLLRMIGSDIILLIINYRFKVRLTDSQNGYRAIRADVARQLDLKENITTIEQEMTIKLLKRGFRCGEVPIHEYARRYGRSSIKLRRVWFRYIWSVIKNIF